MDWLLRIEVRAERRCDTSQMQWLRPWPRSVCWEQRVRGRGLK